MNARVAPARLFTLTAFAALSMAALAVAQDPAAAPPASPPAAQTPPASQPSNEARADLPAGKEILNQCIEAMGGEAAFDAVASSMVKATMATPMGDLALDMSWMKPNMVLIQQTMPGMDSTMGSDGSVSWVKSAMGYKILEPDEAKQMQEQANMFRMVIRLRDDSKELKTVDQTKFSESDCYKVSVTDSDGVVQFAFFDVKDHLLRGIESTQDTQMGQMTSTIKFGEWKEDAGLKFFTKIDIEQMGMNMTLSFNEVKFNTLEAATFALPDEVKAMLKGDAGGATTAPATAPGGGH